MRFRRNKSGVWFRELSFSDSESPTYQEVDPKTALRLESQYGQTQHIIDEKAEVVGVQKEALKELIKETQRDMLEEYGLQQIKDKASLEDQPSGGGVVRLGNYKKMSELEYEDARKAVYDLYRKKENGDKKAEIILDQLWEMSIPLLKKMEREGTRITIQECPKCGAGVLPDSDPVCPVCKWNSDTSGFSKYGEWATNKIMRSEG